MEERVILSSECLRDLQRPANPELRYAAVTDAETTTQQMKFNLRIVQLAEM